MPLLLLSNRSGALTLFLPVMGITGQAVSLAPITYLYFTQSEIEAACSGDVQVCVFRQQLPESPRQLFGSCSPKVQTSTPLEKHPGGKTPENASCGIFSRVTLHYYIRTSEVFRILWLCIMPVIQQTLLVGFQEWGKTISCSVLSCKEKLYSTLMS